MIICHGVWLCVLLGMEPRVSCMVDECSLSTWEPPKPFESMIFKNGLVYGVYYKSFHYSGIL